MALSFGENLGVLGNIKLTDVKLVAGAFRTIASGSDTGSITVQRVEDGQIVYIQSEDRLIKASKVGATVNWSNFYFPSDSAGAETAGIFVATGSSFNTTNDLEITGSLTTTQTGSFGKILGDGSEISNLPSAAIQTYSSVGDNRIVTSVNSTTVQGESNLTFNGAALNLVGSMTASGDISGSATSTGSFANLVAVDKLELGGPGSQFFAFNEDTVKVKFANWYSSNYRQYGMGQLWYETWFGAIDNTVGRDNRRIGFYLETPNAGAGDALGGAGKHPSNPRFYVDVTGSYVNSGSLYVTDGDFIGSATSTGSFGIVQSEGLTANESVIVASDGKSLTSSDLISYDTANSRVGIGTTSPSVKLDIVGESSGETQVRMGQHSDDSDAPDVRLFKSRGSVTSPTAVNNLDNLAFFNSFAYNGSSYVQAGAFGWQADGTDGDSRFIINTRIDNTVATRLLINPVGDVVLSHNISGSSASTGSFGRVEATKFVGDGSELTNVTSPITVKDEGSNLTTEVSSIDFVGTGVTATTDGNNVTATIAGADLVNVFESDGNGDLQPSDSNNGISVFYEYDDNNDITTRT